MSIFRSMWRLVKAIVKKVWNCIKNFIKKFWWVILIIVMIYFAPVMLAYLVEIGAPEFLVTAIEFVATELTPLLTEAVTSIGEVTGELWTSTAAEWSTLDWTTKLAIGVGASAVICPDETAEVVSEVTKTTASLIGSALSGALAAVTTSSLWKWALAGAAVWLLWSSGDDTTVTVKSPEVLPNV